MMHEDSPAPSSRAFDLALSAASSRFEPGAALALSAGVRQAFERRADELRARLAPAEARAIAEALASLRALPGADERGGRPETGNAVLPISPKLRGGEHPSSPTLTGHPGFALAAAAAHFRRSVVGGEDRTAGELARLARAKAEPFRAELWKIERALAAASLAPRPPVPRERRIAMAARWRAIAAAAALPSRLDRKGIVR